MQKKKKCWTGRGRLSAKGFRLWPARISNIKTATTLSRFIAGRLTLSFVSMDIPILFQTARLHGKPPAKTAEGYRDICRGYPHVLAFELGSMFAANGEIWNSETVRRLMDIPEIKGMKHSSLDRLLELERLDLRDAHRPDFRIYTGNDLGINMIEYGSDCWDSPPSRPRNSPSGTASGRPEIPPTTPFPTHCNTWETSPFARRFPRTNIQRLCS